MWCPRVMDLRFPLLWLLIAAVTDFTSGLRDVRVTVPAAVRKGENAQLICEYDLEGDSLYSIKWYKGRREFYRYTPKENPPSKTFPVSVINVDRMKSNVSHLLLTDVDPSISGKFSCEISADAPSFHTQIVSSEMEIVELPEQKPLITGIHNRYRQGDTLQGNCTSHHSKPTANLTWTINDVAVNPTYVRAYDTIKSVVDNLESSVLELNFIVTSSHFNNSKNRLKLKCIARVYNIYEQSEEKLVEDDRPKIMASGASGHNMNMFSPYDQQQDGELNDQNGLYLTHYKAEIDGKSTGRSTLSLGIAQLMSIVLLTSFVVSAFCPSARSPFAS